MSTATLRDGAAPYSAAADGVEYTVILISNPQCNERWDFELVARHLREIAPDVQTAVLDDRALDWTAARGAIDRRGRGAHVWGACEAPRREIGEGGTFSAGCGRPVIGLTPELGANRGL